MQDRVLDAEPEITVDGAVVGQAPELDVDLDDGQGGGVEGLSDIVCPILYVEYIYRTGSRGTESCRSTASPALLYCCLAPAYCRAIATL